MAVSNKVNNKEKVQEGRKKEQVVVLELTAKEHLKGSIKHLFSKVMTYVTLVMMLWLTVDVIARVRYAPDTITTFYIVALALAFVAVLVVFPISMRNASKKAVGEGGFWEGKTNIHYNNVGVRITGKSKNMSCKWPEIKKVREDKEFFFIAFGKYDFIIMPKRAMDAEQIRDLKACVLKHMDRKHYSFM